jgi:enoyl-CoA hydratase/carnithine racemase
MIRVEDGGGLRLVTLDRPDKANALTREMLVALAEAAEGATAMRGFLLTGAGRAFSAGMDLAAGREGLATDPVWERLSGAIAALPCISIAALNGALAGGAIGMAIACDIRLAVAETRVFYPVMRLGFRPQPSDPGRLAALVGPARAKLMLMGGVRVDAAEALAWGLVDRIVERGALIEAARALAADALAADPAHVAAIKRMVPPR